MTLDPPPADPGAEAGPRRSEGLVLRGTRVAPGLAMGSCLRKDYDLSRVPAQRVPLDRIEAELNRFQRALRASHRQLEELKERLRGKVQEEQIRILDTHVAYLKDSVFLSDVENLILNEQMSLEAAIAKVISDFDRIFRLVENELLRDRAIDLRDVGIRVLRNLELEERGERTADAGPETRQAILVARELSIVDMFDVENERVAGIVTEEGGLTSHAAILARSMRIPTLAGVGGLLEGVRPGDFLIVDATEGVVRVEPDPVVRAQYRQERRETARRGPGAQDLGPVELPLETADGTPIEVAASCGNLPEVEEAVRAGLPAIGLYRTELLYLVDREPPSLEALTAHYGAVLEQAEGRPVTFRLLHADSRLSLGYLHEQREPNPALGVAGVRALLAHEQVLRRQLQALLSVPRGEVELRLAVPFVVDCGELRRVREILFEERFVLRQTDVPFGRGIQVGAVVESPAAALGAADLAREADFLVLGLDSLLQFLMAADRENAALQCYFEPIHPVALRLLARVAHAAREADCPLSTFGASATRRANLPFLLGAGLRSFCVAPVDLAELTRELAGLELDQVERALEAAARATCQADILSLVDRFRHAPS